MFESQMQEALTLGYDMIDLKPEPFLGCVVVCSRRDGKRPTQFSGFRMDFGDVERAFLAELASAGWDTRFYDDHVTAYRDTIGRFDAERDEPISRNSGEPPLITEIRHQRKDREEDWPEAYRRKPKPGHWFC